MPWIETMSDLNEVKAAIEGAHVRRPTIPICATMSYDTRGRTMMGVTGALMAQELAGLGLTAIGANCGNNLPETESAVLEEMHAAAPELILIAKANAGMPRFEGDKLVYDGSPEVMGALRRLPAPLRRAVDWRLLRERAGARQGDEAGAGRGNPCAGCGAVRSKQTRRLPPKQAHPAVASGGCGAGRIPFLEEPKHKVASTAENRPHLLENRLSNRGAAGMEELNPLAKKMGYERVERLIKLPEDLAQAQLSAASVVGSACSTPRA